MTLDRPLAVAIASIKPTNVKGVFSRHASPQFRSLTGSASGGRWGPPGAYSVLYLGRPHESVVAEAYRRLVDDVDEMTGAKVGPRKFVTCEVDVTNVLDLRLPENLRAVGLRLEDLVGPYRSCQRVAQTAHQLGMHGLLAPAATGLGDTFALFERHLPASELPRLIEERIESALPPDPRSATAVDDLIHEVRRRLIDEDPE